MIFEELDALVCDLDGVVYRGDEALPGVADAIDELRAKGVRLLFCTNNSKPTVDQYVDKLAGFGVDAASDEILTSAVVTAETLAERGFEGKRAMVIGGGGIRQCLEGIGVEIDDDPENTSVDLVVVGLDQSFSYEHMKRANGALRGGAAFVATNDDAELPAPNGELLPGAGAILASIERASGRRAETMGKPHRPMMDAAARRLKGATKVAMIGDRPETDLKGARLMNWKTILALSGVTHREDLSDLDFEPDAVVESLAELTSGE